MSDRVVAAGTGQSLKLRDASTGRWRASQQTIGDPSVEAACAFPDGGGFVAAAPASSTRWFRGRSGRAGFAASSAFTRCSAFPTTPRSPMCENRDIFRFDGAAWSLAARRLSRRCCT